MNKKILLAIGSKVVIKWDNGVNVIGIIKETNDKHYIVNVEVVSDCNNKSTLDIILPHNEVSLYDKLKYSITK